MSSERSDDSGFGRKRRGILFVVSAPSGAGKTTLVRRAMAADPSLRLSISYTTRKPRAGELDGRDYHFVSPADFHRLRDENRLAEWAEVFDHAYATPREPLEAAIREGRDILLDVDIQGARAIKKEYPADAVGIFVLPPSLAELERRLRARGTDTEEQIKRRLDRVRTEVKAGRDFGVYDYLVVNDDLERAGSALLAILAAEAYRLGRFEPPEIEGGGS